MKLCKTDKRHALHEYFMYYAEVVSKKDDIIMFNKLCRAFEKRYGVSVGKDSTGWVNVYNTNWRRWIRDNRRRIYYNNPADLTWAMMTI